MKWLPLSNAIVLIGFLAFALSDCSPTQGDSSASGDGGESSRLQWYITCGDPACRGFVPKATLALCSLEKEGDPCKKDGAQCIIKDDMCNKLLACSTKDPKRGAGGCPISRKRYKREIQYLSQKQKEKLQQQVLRIRLARYQYKSAGRKSRKHLGFLIEDQPNIPAVLTKQGRIDLYGYTSMVVAAMQVQARQIKKLQREIKLLRQRRIKERP